MIKYGTFTQVRGYDQNSNWRITQIYHQGLISVELRKFDIINRQGLLGSSETKILFSPKSRDFCRKILPWERTFDNLKKFPGGFLRGCWNLELTDALIGNEVVSGLYSFHGYDIIFLNCVEEGSKQCKNWNDVIPVR